MSKVKYDIDMDLILSDSAAGFAEFYYLIHATSLPIHAYEWIVALYNAKDKKKGSGSNTIMTA